MSISCGKGMVFAVWSYSYNYVRVCVCVRRARMRACVCMCVEEGRGQGGSWDKVPRARSSVVKPEDPQDA